MGTGLPVRLSTMTLSTLGQPPDSALSVGRLQLDDVAAAPAAVGGDDELGPGVLDAVLQRGRREAAEHHRVNRADAVAGVHRDDDLGHQRHVDDDAVAVLHALRAQRVGEAAHFGVQLAVAQAARVARLALEDDGGLVAALGQVHIQAVVRDVQPAVGEPAVVGRLGVIEAHREGLVPDELAARQVRPETDVDPAAARCAHVLQVVRLDARAARGELRSGRERALLQQSRHDVLVHAALSLGATAMRHGRSRPA